MFRRSPRAALAGAGALILAVVTAAIVVSGLQSLRRQDAAFGRIHPIVVARRDLPIGTEVRSGDLATRRVRGAAPEEGTLDSSRAAVGQVVRVPVLAGSALRQGHLVAADRPGRSAVVPPDRRAVRLVIEHGLLPRPGDLVDILATFDPQTLGDGGDPTIVVAAAVPVLAANRAPDLGDTVAVTVLVRPTEARRLAFAASAGTLALALAPPEAATG